MLFYQEPDSRVALSLPYFGYYKVVYSDPRDLEERMIRLGPNETPFILKTTNGNWLVEKLEQVQRRSTKASIPRASVTKVSARPPSQPWILPNGEFVSNTDEEGTRNQAMLARMFNIEVFSRFNIYLFVLLQNAPAPVLGKSLIPMTSQEVMDELKKSPHTLILVFCGDSEHLEPFVSTNPRVRVIRISQQHSHTELFIKPEECECVVERIKTLERNSQLPYVLYRSNSIHAELKLQELLLTVPNVEQVEFHDIPQFISQVDRLKGKYKQLDVITFEDEKEDLRKILEDFRIHPYNLLLVRRDNSNSLNYLRLDSKLEAGNDVGPSRDSKASSLNEPVDYPL